MATPPSGPHSSSPWTPFIFGGIFLVAAALIFAGVLSHADTPATASPGETPETNAPAAP